MHCEPSAGVGSSLAYSPTIVTVGQYFSRRRALANGLSVAGSGLGNFAVPPMIRAALDRYGFAGTMLVMAGLMLNVCLAGALLRPLSSYRQRLPPATTTGGPDGQGSDGRLRDGHLAVEAPVVDTPGPNDGKETRGDEGTKQDNGTHREVWDKRLCECV